MRESTSDKLITAGDRLDDALKVGQEALDAIEDIRTEVEDLEDKANDNAEYRNQFEGLMAYYFSHLPTDNLTPGEMREIIGNAIDNNGSNPINYHKGFFDALRLIKDHFAEVTNG